MVVLILKKQEHQLFPVEFKTEDSIDQVTRKLTSLFNEKLVLERLLSEFEELIAYGTIKDVPGLDEEELEAKRNGTDEEKGQQSNEMVYEATGNTVIGVRNRDPTGRRIGVQPLAERSNILRSSIENAKAILKNVNALPDFRELVSELKGCVMIIWPQGLHPHDPVQTLLSYFELSDDWAKQRDLLAGESLTGWLDLDTALLWWAGKCLDRNNPHSKLQDYIGRNEKTRIIVKLAKPGSGPPVREPAVSPEIQKNMMAFYHKKAEEFKRMEEEADRDVATLTNSTPRETQSLKQSFQGLSSNIRFR